jgi:hypothetical protein
METTWRIVTLLFPRVKPISDGNFRQFLAEPIPARQGERIAQSFNVGAAIPAGSSPAGDDRTVVGQQALCRPYRD